MIPWHQKVKTETIEREVLGFIFAENEITVKIIAPENYCTQVGRSLNPLHTFWLL